MNTDEEDDDLDPGLGEEQLREHLIHKMRTEGAWVAYRTAVNICRDPKATAAAKASAVNSLFRANNFFSNQEIDDREKDLAALTPAEMNAELRKAMASLARQTKTKPTGGVFD